MSETNSSSTDARRPRGILAPVLTPFHSDLSPDARRLARHCRWLLAHGCAALVPFGTTSEANSLSVDEREGLLDAILEEGIPADHLLPGTGACSLTDAVRLTAQAVGRGCAGVLMLPPFYYKAVGEDGFFRFFAEVIERVGDARLKIYLYHFPPVAHVGFSANLVERLLHAYPRTIAGMKDSSGDFGNTKTMLHAFAGAGFDLFVGSERFLLAGMREGCAGCISATANVNAAAIDRLYRAWRSPEAEGLQAEVDAVRGAVEKVPLIPGLKTIVAHFAVDPAWVTVRPPLGDLTPAQRAALLADVAALKLALPDMRG